MNAMRTTLLLAALGAGDPVTATDLAAISRTIAKEPAYQTKAPRYGLLVFGPQAKYRVWLVHDGDVLYVDRNGNGNLTEPGERVAATIDKNRSAADTGSKFEVGDLRIGDRTHKGLTVYATPLDRYGSAMQTMPNAKAALAADPKTLIYTVALDVERPGFQGLGVGGRVVQMAGSLDSNGVLLFAAKSADAPIIHFDGPLQINFYAEKPILKLERNTELYLVVGTPGHGRGTFASLGYEDTIPNGATAKAEISFPATTANSSPIKELFELKQRC